MSGFEPESINNDILVCINIQLLVNVYAMPLVDCLYYELKLLFPYLQISLIVAFPKVEMNNILVKLMLVPSKPCQQGFYYKCSGSVDTTK